MTDLPPPPPPGGYSPPWGYAPSPPVPVRPGPPASSLASFGERFLAHLVDWLILSSIMFVTMIALITVIALGPSHTDTCRTYEYSDELGQQTRYEPCTQPNGSTVALAVLIGLAGFAATIALYVYFFRREGRTGQTWGRQAMGIRLLDATTGLPIGGGRSFGRFVLGASISGYFCYLGYFWMLWDDRKQTWHDKIMNTLVVKG